MTVPITDSPKHTHPQHLIVGAGLAGCLLAWRLHQAGQRVVLIGSTSLPSAYSVAAGVINPVTGRWMTKTWNADTLLPLAAETYRAIEQQLQIEVYHPIPELRFCQNAEDIKRVGRRMRNPRYADVLGQLFEPGQAAPEFNDPCGAFEIQQAAYVDLPCVVNALRAHFAKLGCFRDATFTHKKLESTAAGWRYQDVAADKVIFCEGVATRDNPWFKDLPLKPVKGETLLCHCPTLKLPRKLYHHSKWILPYPDGSFRIGATYDETDLSSTPTQARAQELLAAAQSALRENHEIKVSAHLAGVRPSTVDSRPIIGAHPSEAGIYVLNGLGSKGASTAPAMTLELSEHLLKQTPISEEVSPTRFD